MSRRFYIDMENINYQAIEQVDKLTKEDQVCILYTKNTGKMIFDAVCKLVNAQANIEIIKVNSEGLNALDYRLVAKLGSHVVKYKETIQEDKYYIVSNDKGYLAALNIIREQIPGIQANLINTIEKALQSEEMGYIACAS